VATKTILAKALFNLLVREDTRELVDKQDVTQSLLRLMKLQVPELSQICILVRHTGHRDTHRDLVFTQTRLLCEYSPPSDCLCSCPVLLSAGGGEPES
jgi:hypothetical protein